MYPVPGYLWYSVCLCVFFFETVERERPLCVKSKLKKRGKMDPNAITTQFTDHYYNLFGSGQRANMRPLYHDDSSLSFEGTQFNGTQAIIGKLTTLQFQQVAVQCISRDWLPGPNNCLVIMVNGSMQLPGEANSNGFLSS